MSALNPTTEELWKPIAGYEGLYEVSNCGRIKGLAGRAGYHGTHDHIKAQHKNRIVGTEHLRVTLSRDSKRKHHSVHRLVAFAFIGPPPDALHIHINHIDGDPANNCAGNLEWVTPEENVRHAARLGLMPSGDRNGSRLHPERLGRGLRNGRYTKPEQTPRGSKHGMAILTEGQIIDIRQLRDEGRSLSSLAREFHISKTHVSRIVNRRVWTHLLE